MKLNIITNLKDGRGEYTNILLHDDWYIKFPKLDNFADDAECEEIIALDILSYIPAALIDKTIEVLCRKLGHKGQLTIGFTNLQELGKSIVNRSISLEMLNEAIFGKQENGWDFKKSAFSISQVCESFKSMGFKILKKYTENFFSIVTAERP